MSFEYDGMQRSCVKTAPAIDVRWMRNEEATDETTETAQSSII
jgi:hypothetical protein